MAAAKTILLACAAALTDLLLSAARRKAMEPIESSSSRSLPWKPQPEYANTTSGEKGIHRMNISRALRIVGIVLLFHSAAIGTAVADSPREVFSLATLAGQIAIQTKYQESLFSIPGVIGTSVGYRDGEVVLVVFVDESRPAGEVPKELDGLRVVAETGEYPVPLDGGNPTLPDGFHTDVYSLPVPMGVSTGPIDSQSYVFAGDTYCNTGTLGFKACQPGSLTVGWVSANHVVAADSLGCPNRLDDVDQVQPGLLEVVCDPTHPDLRIIGRLDTVHQIDYLNDNTVDAAFVASDDDRTAWDILDIGMPSVYPGTPLLNECVAKSGRTTGFTRGVISDVNYTTAMTYADINGVVCGYAPFVDMIRVVPDATCNSVCAGGVCEPFGKHGDSGSAVVYEAGNQIVGVLIGGVGTSALVSPIQPVLAALDLSLDVRDCGDITVGQPTAGMLWQTGSAQQINWSSWGVVGAVNVDLSRDGGSPWTRLYSHVRPPLNWIATGPATNAAFLRVTSVDYPGIVSFSDQFKIVSLHLTAPNGGEELGVGDDVTIGWTSAGNLGNVDIELSRSGGGPWETILTDVPDSGGATWTVTGPVTDTALVRVSSRVDSRVSDKSDAVFAIAASQFVVDTTGDGSDSNLTDDACDDGTGYCSLRAAIQQANETDGKQTIAFDIPATGVPTIQPTSRLPVVSEPVVIDGTTQSPAGLVELDGSTAGTSQGLYFTSDNNSVRGLVINRFAQAGIAFFGDGDGGFSTVQGCRIGTDPTGTAPLGNGGTGIRVHNSVGNTIGGESSNHGNVLSGNSSGVFIDGGSERTTINRNMIGTALNGIDPIPNSGAGIRINGAHLNLIGSSDSKGNDIAFNGGSGIVISSGSSNAVAANSIHDNGGLGIDLGQDWTVTPNDVEDGDSGANDLLNYPVPSSFTIDASGTPTVSGTFDTEPTSAGWLFAIALWSNASCDPSGYGEGEFLAGTALAVLNGSGDASFSMPLDISLAPGETVYVSATASLIIPQAKQPVDMTSEFSPCLAVTR
jgi:CSLREA domain-containing protein